MRTQESETEDQSRGRKTRDGSYYMPETPTPPLAPRWSRAVRALKKARPAICTVQDPCAPGKEKQFHMKQSRRYISQKEFEFPKAPREDGTEDGQDQPTGGRDLPEGDEEAEEELAIPGPSGLTRPRGGSDTDEGG